MSSVLAVLRGLKHRVWGHPRVATFDVFDTLIARRSSEPETIFHRIESITGIAGFATLRRKAESQLAPGQYGLRDIYTRIQQLCDLTTEEASALEALEVELEVATAIPILENLQRVRNGDLLLSDMYLNPSVILRILRRVGLQGEIELLVSSDGKHTGQTWRRVVGKYNVSLHIGDNAHSDVAMAGRFSIPALHFIGSSLIPSERLLQDAGLEELAMLCREARLGTYHDDAVCRSFQIAQTSMNFPLLVLFREYVLRFARQAGSTNILLCSRDCHHLHTLFGRLSTEIDAQTFEYFYTSRIARMRPSASYKQYASGKIEKSCLIVDLCGTGWSLSHLLENLNSEAECLFLHKLPSVKEYEAVAETRPALSIHALVDRSPSMDAENGMLEFANAIEEPSAIDVVAFGGRYFPVYDRETRSSKELEFISVQILAFQYCLNKTHLFDLNCVSRASDQILAETILSLYSGLSKNWGTFEATDDHARVMTKITSP